jgi:hypothetical protein
MKINIIHFIFMNNIAKISLMPNVLMEIIKYYVDVYDVMDKHRKMNEDYSHRIVYFEANNTLVYKPIDINKSDRAIYRRNNYGDIYVWNFIHADYVKNHQGNPITCPWV